MTVSLKVWGTGLAIALVYVAGVAVRDHYELKITVRNEANVPIRPVLRLNEAGDDIALPELASGRRARRFVHLRSGEASIDLEFDEPGGKPIRKNIIGYTESGYCGNVIVTVKPDFQVTSEGSPEKVACFGSWFEFF